MAILIIFLISLGLGLIKYQAVIDSHKESRWQLKFIEFWNCFTCYLIAGLIGYYFIFIRLPLLSSNSASSGDIVLLVFLILGVFGHLAVISNNVTEGIKAILEKVLARN